MAGLLVALPVSPILAGYINGSGLRPLLVLYSAGLAVAIAWIFGVDRWAGLLVGYFLLRGIPFPPLAFETVLAITAGASVYCLAKRAPRECDSTLHGAIGVAGAFVAGYMFGEWLCVLMDLPVLWGGGVGNTNHVGSFLAISSVAAPMLLLPLWILGIIGSKSAVGALAFGAVLIFRFPHRVVAAGVGVVVLVATMLARGIWSSSLAYRIAVWKLGLSLWQEHPLFGLGPGAWVRSGFRIDGPAGREWWASAHNEWVQLLFEGGLLALIGVLGWIYVNRHAFLTPLWGPGLFAVMITSLASFPFQMPAVAVLCLVTMGLAARSVP